ncbi:MAG: carbamoyltransferase HypF [Patescibacteria group bacterium]
MSIVRKHFSVTGTVQGVGFRPFVYRLAQKYGLFGLVYNTTQGVEIDIEGPIREIRAFGQALQTPPPSAHIENIIARLLPPKKYRVFRIMESARGANTTLAIPPDLDVCKDCARELFDKNDRRFRYPFINCTNCGPRFTIVESAPYDRARTTMRRFRMCKACAKEYKDPTNRRFHAEPNACPVCGPQLTLLSAHGTKISARDPVVKTAALVRKGHIIAILGVGGFHLVCRADSAQTVAKLRVRKHRPHKPLAVMACDIAHAKKFARISSDEARLLQSSQKPIVIVSKRKNSILAGTIAPQNNKIGVMLPYTPLHHLLMQELNMPIVATSGNRSGDPIICDTNDGFRKLSGIADYFLVHDRPISNRCDDSVLSWHSVLKREIFMRRSRGFVPLSVRSPFSFQKSVLATGGQMKSVFAVTQGTNAVMSQHIGELEHADTAEFFEKNAELFEKLLDAKPAIIAHDMHSDYFTTRWALKQKNIQKVAVQHHHAHFASCLLDNKMPRNTKAVGVVWDGTGYGTDSTVWGGEFFYGDYGGVERIAHLRPFTLPGGEVAIREPWRIAAGILDDMGIAPKSDLERSVVAAKRKHINAPLCSSAGRLFDAVSALLGVCTRTTYEAQAAIELESLATRGTSTRTYPFAIDTINTPWQIDFHPIIAAIRADLRRGIKKETIAYRFHLTMAEVIAQTASRIARRQKTSIVALSGGVFQNSLLLGLAWRKLEARKLVPLFHQQVPSNDGGLAVGQAVISYVSRSTRKN